MQDGPSAVPRPLTQAVVHQLTPRPPPGTSRRPCTRPSRGSSSWPTTLRWGRLTLFLKVDVWQEDSAGPSFAAQVHRHLPVGVLLSAHMRAVETRQWWCMTWTWRHHPTGSWRTPSPTEWREQLEEEHDRDKNLWRGLHREDGKPGKGVRP